MSEMIERVARALHAREYDSWPEPACTQCMDAARAAIEAMREPTDKMVDAGRDADNGEERNLGEAGARDCWARMIDEALK